MITRTEINELFVWAKDANVPLRPGPTAEGYSSTPISFCWLKKDRKNVIIRRTVINNEKIENIFENPDILFSMIVIFDKNTELKPHRDPNLYREKYKRIQIPLTIPSKEKCYMIWKGEKIYWTEGEPQVFEVMDVVHEGYNYSEYPMAFLFLDVKKDTILCNDK